jgi:thioester reductase-like protein
MEKKYLYLDDVRTPVDDKWIVCRNYDEFVTKVRFHGLSSFDVISLDHDLGEQAMVEYYTNVRNNYKLDYENIIEKTGYDAAKFLVAESMAKNIPLPQVYVHSANPIGSANMMGYINNYLMNCRLPQTCVRVNIEHTIDEEIQLSPEARKARWDRSKEQ